MTERVYLDWNATAPLRPEARLAFQDALAVQGNPSSVHAEGRAARRLIEGAREQVAALVGGAPWRRVLHLGRYRGECARLVAGDRDRGREAAARGAADLRNRASFGSRRRPLPAGRDYGDRRRCRWTRRPRCACECACPGRLGRSSRSCLATTRPAWCSRWRRRLRSSMRRAACCMSMPCRRPGAFPARSVSSALICSPFRRTRSAARRASAR